MKEYKITKERLKAMAEECPQAEGVLKKGFPEAFEEEWGDVTPNIIVKFSPNADAWYMELLDGNAWITNAGSVVKIEKDGCFTIKFYPVDDDYKLVQSREGENIKILKRRGK